MPHEHPAFVYSDQAEEWFDIKDGIIIAIENRDGIYNPETLTKIKQITKELQKMEEIEKSDVTSLYTADNIIGTEDGMDVKPFYKKVPKSQEDLDELRERVRTNEMVFGRIVSEGETVSVIIARIGDDVFSQKFYRQILELGHSYEGPEKVYVAGRPIVEGTMALLGPADMKKMVPIVLVVILLVLFAMLRSVGHTLLTMMVVFISTVWTFGLMALVGIPIYAVSTMIPVMLIAIGVADGIHLFSHLDIYLAKNPGESKLEAMRDMLREMWAPVVMTSVTTAVGFISLLTSQVYPIKYFGLFTAFGVLAAMILSLYLIPAWISIFGLSKLRLFKGKSSDGQIGRISAWSSANLLKHWKLVLGLAVVIIALSIYGTTQVWINSSFLDKFEKDSDIVLTDQFINEHFGGTSTLNLILESPEAGTFKSPEIMELVDELQEEVESIEVVGSSFGLADYLKRMNKVMHADAEEFNTIPESSDLNAQYLLLYEMSGDPENLWQVTDFEYRKLNLTFQLKGDNSKATNEAISSIESFRERFESRGIKMNYAGSGYTALVFTDLILKGQVTSLLLSLVIIILLLSLMFKNFRAGLIGAIPITITAMISFGVMGLLGIPLSSTTALLSSISIGIGIDYAVHFLDRYRVNLRSNGDIEQSLTKTMSHSGRAITFNAVVVIAGFMVLLFSVFPPNRELGGLVSMNMFTSFSGTLTVMALIIVRAKLFSKNRK
ncbi:MAG: efflux RND transporter permease subunit [Candidatus Electryonea clarkiae]|nr:efflux RND transporter permease subunit [Candidatus Electryonea clarkiae]MDP8289272.1 efflux RND transporter permease subunit [Candidatus Electryonea clarkiae]